MPSLLSASFSALFIETISAKPWSVVHCASLHLL